MVKSKGDFIGRSLEALPDGHARQTEGKPCTNVRELGECKLKGCKAKHDGNGFLETECTDPMYLEFQICPNALNSCPSGKLCLHKHKRIAKLEDYIKAKEKAIQAQPAHYSNLKWKPIRNSKWSKGKRRSGGVERYKAAYATISIGVESVDNGVEHRQMHR